LSVAAFMAEIAAGLPPAATTPLAYPATVCAAMAAIVYPPDTSASYRETHKSIVVKHPGKDVL